MQPDKNTLERLYCEERRSTRHIGKLFGVSQKPVIRWLNACNIPLRPFGRGLCNRGITPPTEQELRSMLSDGTDKIAERFGVDVSAVYQWLRQFRIQKHCEIKEPTREELESLYIGNGLTAIEIAAVLNCSKGTVLNRLRQMGIPARSDKWGRERPAGTDGHVVKSTYELRVCNWLTKHGIAHDYEPRLFFSKRFRADFRVGDTFIEIWGMECDPQYAKRKAIKRELYRLNNVSLIELSSHHFRSRGVCWTRVLTSKLLSLSPKQKTLAL